MGIHGNEKVDSLTKNVTLLEPNSNMYLPFTDFSEQYKRNAISNTNKTNEEQGLEKGRDYFLLYHTYWKPVNGGRT